MMKIPVPVSLREAALCSGVYFLFSRGHLVYIGRSRNVANRVSKHLATGDKSFDSVSWIPVAEHLTESIEAAYIKANAPLYNVQRPARSAPIANPVDGVDDTSLARILFKRDLSRRYGVARETIWRWMRAGKLPRPDVTIGDRPGWTEDYLRAFELSREPAGSAEVA